MIVKTKKNKNKNEEMKKKKLDKKKPKTKRTEANLVVGKNLVKSEVNVS